MLLRAVRVEARVRCGTAEGYRALFRRLWFLQLLFEAKPEDDGYRIAIEGPFHLFASSTRYGLKLALALPVLAACDACSLAAEVRWGKQRAKRTFVWDKEDAPSFAPAAPPSRRDEVEQLLGDLASRESPFDVDPEPDLLHLPGVGVCVPDLSLVHRESGERVYVEVLGFWSREAVWRRVELVERGLSERIVFCASSRLRVSEQALGEDASAALYVFKGVLRAKGVLEKAEALIRR